MRFYHALLRLYPSSFQNLTPRYILPAVREPGDDKSAPVIPREDYVSPYGPSPVSGPVLPIQR